VPFSVISTNSTPLRSQNKVAITLSADLTILNFFDRGYPGCFYFMLAILSPGSDWWTHVSSPVTMRSRKSWPWVAYCWRNERALTILCALWSSDSARGTHLAQTLWKPNSWIILIISHAKPPNHAEAHSQSLFCYPRLLLQHVLCSRGCFLLLVCHFSCYPLSQLDRIWSLTPFRHTSTTHRFFPVNFD
jgi:hypothetical protein